MLYPSQIKQCRECGAEITFVKSSGGEWYPANVIRVHGSAQVEYQGQGGFVRGKAKNFTFPLLHQCPANRESIQATIDRLRGQLMEAEAANEAGSWFDATAGIEAAIRVWEGKLEALA